MIRVLEIISDRNIGGAGRLLLARLACMDRKRFHVKVIVPEGSLLYPKLAALRLEVDVIHAGADSSWDAGACFELLFKIKEFRPHILHAHGSLSARIAAFVMKVPVSVYTRHCVFPTTKQQRRKWVRSAQKWFCRLVTDGVIAVSPAAKANLMELGIAEAQIHVIMNGCQAISPTSATERERFKQSKGIPKDAVVIGICARLEPYKDHLCFLRAAKRLIRASGDRRYCFVILGDGSLYPFLRKRCKAMGLESYVIMPGFVHDPSAWINIFDVNVNCSIGTETSSLALSEGMSLGIPAVVSDFGGNPYMVTEEENGLIFPCGRDDILAEKISALISDATRYRRCSDGARKRFERELNAQTMTERYERLYMAFLRQKRVGHPF